MTIWASPGGVTKGRQLLSSGKWFKWCHVYMCHAQSHAVPFHQHSVAVFGQPRRGAHGVTLLVNIITSPNFTRGRYDNIRNFNSDDALVLRLDRLHSPCQVGGVDLSTPVGVKLPQLRLAGLASASMTFTTILSFICETPILHDTSLLIYPNDARA